jgi:hypothetical protein
METTKKILGKINTQRLFKQFAASLLKSGMLQVDIWRLDAS